MYDFPNQWYMPNLAQTSQLTPSQMPTFTPNVSPPSGGYISPALNNAVQNFLGNYQLSLNPQLQQPLVPQQRQASWTPWQYADIGIRGGATLANSILGGVALHQRNKDLKLQRRMAMNNLAQAIKSYNNTLEDQLRARYRQSGREDWEEIARQEFERKALRRTKD